jgi:hypothetical protein
MSYSRRMKKPGTLVAVSQNKGGLAVSNEEGWTVVELLGREGEIAVSDTVFARDWLATGREDLVFNGEVFSAIFLDTGDKQWAIRQIDHWGGS